ncbi:glutamate-cysteine ligase-domain-containing protein [Protomyces lactucae-debilis]|uniref:Glutamate--cysteine ligase n=1 Tax=Protomyces lactucae-debilis TaxID=2754530 RepID=A0A1Y2FFF2_PROLT|nr:glutamate-cysteine ligase-domain-containing protein [Protomyces lactucae-debilis]ORY82690.1 glutamate-cysteine ligase-domain-containing protein [Protomyces lactucae-debilis]
MGLLSLGTPLPWHEVKKHAEHVREHGIKQFLHIWNRNKGKERDQLLWGDEIEYVVVCLDDEKKTAMLSLRQADILHALADDEHLQRKGGVLPDLQTTEREEKDDLFPTFHPEYGRYMLEATPGAPYGHELQDLLNVLPNMLKRRVVAKAHMFETECPITLTSYPRLGVPGPFTTPYYEPHGPASRSLFVPDEIINPHARFPTLTANIRERRGRKVAMNVPIFYDENTPKPFIDPTIPRDRNLYPEDANAREGAAKEGHIYMDSMGFGMGCCCLQITFQTKNVNEARRLYDQLAPLGPIMLALSAASPLWRGYIADQDTRWNVIAGAVDDRTPQELGEEPLTTDRFVIPKSRYDSISAYISEEKENLALYNDIEFPKDQKIRQILKDGGIDDKLADHMSHLFIRDPIVIFSELLEQDDSTSSDHFENIQSTNWQTVRFKPPPPETDIGWRVEFRSMEIQITDFENAAFSIFIVLLTRAILSFKLNLYIPISKVDENMRIAHKRDAALADKFWFRTDVFPSETASQAPTESSWSKLSIHEIINGSGDSFAGLIPLIESYLNSVNCDVATRCELGKYLDLVSYRASGKLCTAASWIRNFVRSHPAYKHDSVVSELINYDLVKAVQKLSNPHGREAGVLGAEAFLGKFGL